MDILELEEQVLQTIAEYSMLPSGSTVTVGFSGGADSMALLYLLHRYSNVLGVRLQAAHVNHLLRGEESERDQQVCEQICRKWEIPLFTAQIDVADFAANHGESVEVAARILRYRFLQEVASGSKIATAHTRSDSVETVIFHLARGTGMAGLLGIPPVRGNIIRPLICLTRTQIEDYCLHYMLPFITDSSNLSDDYSRNRIRHWVVPALRQINPAMEDAVAQAGSLLQADHAYLNMQAAQAQKAITTTYGISRSAWLALPSALSNRILINLLTTYHLPYSAARIAQMRKCMEQIRHLQLSSTHTLYSNTNYTAIREHHPPAMASKTIPHILSAFPVEYSVQAEKKVRISVRNYEEFEKIKNSSPKRLKNCLDYDRLEESLILRTRQAGDTFRTPQRGLAKTLKNLFQELAIPAWERNNLLMVEAGGELVWLEPVGASAHACATVTTTRVIEIEIELQTGEAK